MTNPDLRAKAEAGSAVAQTLLGIRLLEGLDCPPDHAEAFRWLTAAAEQGAPRATLNLGVMYERGLHVAQDAARARNLYEAAGHSGEFLGWVFLARLLVNGTGGPVDPPGAQRCYREALAQEARVQESPELDEARSYVASHGSSSG